MLCAGRCRQSRRLGFELAAEILDQRARKSVDGAQWRAQVVRHGVGEQLEFGAGRAHILKRPVEPRVAQGERDAQALKLVAEEQDDANQRRDGDQRQNQRHRRSPSACAMLAASSDGS